MAGPSQLPPLNRPQKMPYKSSQSSVLSDATSSSSTSKTSENSSAAESSSAADNSDEDADSADDSEDAVCAPSDNAQSCQTGLVTSNGDSKDSATAGNGSPFQHAQNDTSFDMTDTRYIDPEDAAYDGVDLISESDDEEQKPESELLAITSEAFPEYTFGDLSTYTDPATLAWDDASGAFNADMVFDELSHMRYSEVSLADFPISSPPMTPIASGAPDMPSTPVDESSNVILVSPLDYRWGSFAQAADSDIYSDSGTTDQEVQPPVETADLQNIHPKGGLSDSASRPDRQESQSKTKPRTKMIPKISTFVVDPSCPLGQPGEKVSDVAYSMPIIPKRRRRLPSLVSARFLPESRRRILSRPSLPPVSNHIGLDPTIGVGTDVAMAGLIEGVVPSSSPSQRSTTALPDFVPADSQFLRDLTFQEANSDHESTDLDIADFMYLDEDSSNSDEEAKCLKLWEGDVAMAHTKSKGKAALPRNGPLTPRSNQSNPSTKSNGEALVTITAGSRRKRKSCEVFDNSTRPHTRLRSQL